MVKIQTDWTMIWHIPLAKPVNRIITDTYKIQSTMTKNHTPLTNNQHSNF